MADPATRPTFDQMTEAQRQKVGEALWHRERPRCQSCLVDELMKRGDVDGFTIDDITNLTPDPSDWSLNQCREYVRDHGTSPDPDPWSMTREAIVELLTGVDIECRPDEPLDILREALIVNIEDETIDGLEDWREAVRDCAEPAEPYEWWEVGDWLAERLEREGECVIRNGYGDWWGRCCTGQAVYLDHVIQRLGAEYCGWAIDPE